MTATNITPAPTAAEPTWRRVIDLADLVEIFDPEMGVSPWQPEIDPAIKTYLSEQQQIRELETIEPLSSRARTPAWPRA